MPKVQCVQNDEVGWGQENVKSLCSHPLGLACV